MEETRIDLRESSPEDIAEGVRSAQFCFKINHTMPFTEEYNALVKELFCNGFGVGSRVMPGLTVVRAANVKIGNNVVVMNNCLMMAAGGITIDDDARVAANVQLISNNHDLYDREVLLCKPVHLKRNCWIGAGSSIMPGVTVGKNAVVGAASVVTHDVPDNAVVVGSPAKVTRMIGERKEEDAMALDNPINKERVEHFKQLAEDHYRTICDINYYASELCISPNYLTRLTKEYLGISPRQYLLNRVTIEAKRLLTETDQPIARIADELHFETVSYFNKYFKKYTGMTPTEYRQQNGRK